MRIRWPSVAEGLVQAALTVLVLLDLLVVSTLPSAEACRMTPMPVDCLTFGGAGPYPWYYASRSLYLATLLAGLGIALLGLLAPFLTRRPWHGLLLTGAALGLRLAGIAEGLMRAG